jgi:hypothetical protein
MWLPQQQLLLQLPALLHWAVCGSSSSKSWLAVCWQPHCRSAFCRFATCLLLAALLVLLLVGVAAGSLPLGHTAGKRQPLH